MLEKFFYAKRLNFFSSSIVIFLRKNLRLKVKLVDKQVNIYGFSNWEQSDEYYVFKNDLYSNVIIGVCDEVQVNADLLKNNVIYYIDFYLYYYSITKKKY